ncbi:GNAT family N-acetyltransferase [Hymenobacter busanensis]|uniref:GNAT family N-acetyltransferase n=1 Tax=Hymenobacter busanensis TaxID=2607656 RepID=A0A7L5A214_9BACT|nr:GNAT family N-acetyltransferase [Hymenobacter busanensis]KAA9338517.1 GNAT family N-acetyltransferase [Hymenobacter busanensis]QHJ09055.1 GNAT family N-acetyltransferase [Hymenobacter busanensis]
MLDRPQPPTEICTPRLLLRPWQPADAPALWAMLTSEAPRLLRNFPRTLGAVTDEASAAAFIALREADWAIGAGFQYGIWPVAAPGRCAGLISLRDVLRSPFDVPKAEVAYFVGAAFEGQGLLREGLVAVLGEAAFEALRLEKVFARILPDNERSRQLALRLGFVHGGRLRREFRQGDDGRYVDIDYFDLLRTDWVARSTETA